MKKIYRLFSFIALAGTFSLTSCIEETIPTNLATEEQMQSSSKASEALAWAMPAFLNHYGTYSGDYAYDWGYGSVMHIRDVMTGDMAVVSSGYNWYSSWSQNSYLGPRYVSTYFLWAYHNRAIQTANNTIGQLKGSTDKDMMGYLATGYAYRAFFYLDVARMYEFLPNDVYGVDYTTDEGNEIAYLTVPIVTEETSEEDCQNNPRVTHEEMAEFILSDLEAADSLMNETEFEPVSKTLPSLACVYGLKARLHMWNAGYYEEIGNQEKADEEYYQAWNDANTAIQIGAKDLRPMTEEEWLDTKTGFNDMSNKAWMWASSASTDDDVVQSGILNWTSWMSNEATFGYAAAGPYIMIASELYSKISSKDFRKLSFKAPASTSLEGKEPLVISNENDKNYMYSSLPEYASFKFRPGSGDVEEYKVGAACDYPLMRVEEMYLIAAEAAAHLSPDAGKTELVNFMKNYRNSSYSTSASGKDAIIAEIILQKRIELWGEGQLFFDYKRLNMSVDRTKSTNWDDTERFKTNGRPEWMNLCITDQEDDNNKGVKGYSNPDPSGSYKPIPAKK